MLPHILSWVYGRTTEWVRDSEENYSLTIRIWTKIPEIDMVELEFRTEGFSKTRVETESLNQNGFKYRKMEDVPLTVPEESCWTGWELGSGRFDSRTFK